ncbi:MAG TPA: hypothetical protein VLK84_17165 [Longimicrobium sp.]|nr:hypothetical protein [Longimicrobium sp.]
MKKLTLKADDLKVLSFETAPVRGPLGTVHGAAATEYTDGASCENHSECWTCGIWCPETTNPDVTAPCNCPGDTQAPAC